tara:strand:- start:526 stop:879 length:354 start_codon:yes stop_codon:yes gene_type:complete
MFNQDDFKNLKNVKLDDVMGEIDSFIGNILHATPLSKMEPINELPFPGSSKEDIKITLEKDSKALRVIGSTIEGDKEFVLLIPKAYDTDSISSSYDNGVLRITIDKKKPNVVDIPIS